MKKLLTVIVLAFAAWTLAACGASEEQVQEIVSAQATLTAQEIANQLDAQPDGVTADEARDIVSQEVETQLLTSENEIKNYVNQMVSGIDRDLSDEQVAAIASAVFAQVGSGLTEEQITALVRQEIAPVTAELNELRVVITDTVALQQQGIPDTEDCRAKQITFNEDLDEDGQLLSHRIDLSFNGPWHLDYYLRPGEKPFSIYGIGYDRRLVLKGFGSLFYWEEECEVDLEDLEADVRTYRESRGDGSEDSYEILNTGLGWTLEGFLDDEEPEVNIFDLQDTSVVYEILEIRDDPLTSTNGLTSTTTITTTTGVTTTGETTTDAGGVCKGVQQPASDGETPITADGTTLSVEAWGGTLGDAFVIVPDGETVEPSWQGGALWDYGCVNTAAVINDVSGRGRPVYLVVEGELELQE